MLQSQRIASRSCIFVTADVTSLCTNIPHWEGIDAVKYYMKQIPLSARMQHYPSIAFIDIILETILTHSTFKFSNEFYHQKTGTSMGTRMAPPYTNLFMGRVDAKIMEQYPQSILFYKRFIDDIF